MNNIKEERVTDLSIIMEMIDSKPYYSVQYRNVGEIGCHIGYSSYNLKTVLEFIGEYFEIVENDSKQTNADRIRNMTDEELAKFLITFKNTFGEEYEGEVSCMEWLQSEAE
jgi:hypothetical protein